MKETMNLEARTALCNVYTFLLRRRYARLAQQSQTAAAASPARAEAAAADDPAPGERMPDSMQASEGLSTDLPDYGGAQ